MIVIQAAIFYIGKIISSKYGGQVADIFQGLTGSRKVGEQDDLNTSYEWTSPSKPKRHMRGPRMKPRDIRNMEKKEEP
jgi:hypothetical protein